MKKQERNYIPNRKNIMGKTLKKQWPLLIILTPGMIWYLIFRYLPMAGIAYSFTDFGFRPRISFIGLENFIRLFNSMDFYRAFTNTMIISFLNLVFFFPLPIILALLMNEIISTKLKKSIQFIVYIPHFFSWVVVGGLFVMILSPSQGIVNRIIEALGGRSVYFMASPEWFRQILVGTHIWRDVGYGTVIYIATLSTIDRNMYDSAIVDGAGRWSQARYITLPSLKSTIAAMLLLTLANILKIFEQVLIMYNDAVKGVSEVLKTYSFSQGLLNGDIGYATAIGLFTSIVSFILVFGVNGISKKFLDESIL